MAPQELNDAATEANVPLLRELLGQLQPEEREQWLCTAVLRAAYENRLNVVRALLDVGASPASVDNLGNTSLHWAARQGYEALVQLLIERKVAVGAQSQDGSTPLHLASELNLGPIVQMLLKGKADPAAVTQDKRTALHMAADRGSAVASVVLLECKLEDTGGREIVSMLLEQRNDKGETPLARAAARGNAAVVQLMLRAHADPGLKNFWGQGALHLAALGGHIGAVAVLLDSAADVNVTAQDGSTPLHTALDRGHSQVVELLLSKGALTDARVSRGRAPLHAAAERGNLEAVDALLAHEADPNARNDDKQTPLAYAAARGHVIIIQRLVEHKATPQAFDALGQTAMHAAAVAGRSEAISTLIKNHARVDHADAAGRTPIVLALAGRHDAAVRILLKRGAQLPEEIATAKDMQPLIQEVENEVLHEQLKEAAEGKIKEQLVAAEKEFEDARLKVLNLASLTTAAIIAPSIHAAERNLSDVTQLYQLHHESEGKLQLEFNNVAKTLSDTDAQISSTNQALRNSKKAVIDLRTARNDRLDQVRSLQRDMAEALAATKSNESREEKLDAKIEETKGKVEVLNATLRELQKDSGKVSGELAQVREQLAKWHEEKEEAAQLHAQAHALLNRREAPA